MGRVLGLVELRDALRSLGRGAELVPAASVDWLPRGLFSSEPQVVLVQGSPVDLVTARMQGMVGPRQALSAGAFGVSFGVLPIAARTVLPVRIELVVRLPGGPRHAARLTQSSTGWFRRTRTGLAWSGGALADQLRQQPALLEVLGAELGLDDALSVAPEPTVVRIVLQRLIVAKLGLAAGKDLAAVERPPVGPALLGALEQLATAVRAT